MHRLRNEETNQFAIEITQVNGRIIQRHNKMALVRGNFTDEEERDKNRQEAPLTTPEHASVLGALCRPTRVVLQVA